MSYPLRGQVFCLFPVNTKSFARNKFHFFWNAYFLINIFIFLDYKPTKQLVFMYLDFMRISLVEGLKFQNMLF